MTYRKDGVTDLNDDGMGGVPALFKRFADQAGLRYSVSLKTAAANPRKLGRNEQAARDLGVKPRLAASLQRVVFDMAFWGRRSG